MTIGFSFPEEPNGCYITNDQFASIHAIVAQDWSRNYEVSEPPYQGPTKEWFLLVEKKADGDQETEAIYRIESDGDCGLLWKPLVRVQLADTPELVRRHENIRIKLSHQPIAEQALLDEDYMIVDELVKRQVLDK
jgi:hypothetical protein